MLRDFIFTNLLEAKTREALQNDLNGFPDRNGFDMPLMAGPEHFHSRSFIRCNADLKNLMDSVGKAYFGRNDEVLLKSFKKSTWPLAKCQLFETTREICRNRQPELNEEPSSSLTSVWVRPVNGDSVAVLPPCFLCKEAFTARNTFGHTIMRLHYDDFFHLKCILSKT